MKAFLAPMTGIPEPPVAGEMGTAEHSNRAPTANQRKLAVSCGGQPYFDVPNLSRFTLVSLEVAAGGFGFSDPWLRKSTVLRILAGRALPFRGKVKSADAPETRRDPTRVVYLPEKPSHGPAETRDGTYGALRRIRFEDF